MICHATFTHVCLEYKGLAQPVLEMDLYHAYIVAIDENLKHNSLFIRQKYK